MGANAQQNDRIQVFGGYSLVGYSIFQRYSGPWALYRLNGWEVAGTVRLLPHLGAEGDFGGASTSIAYKTHTYMGGARVFADLGRNKDGDRRLSPYTHLLFGELKLTSSGDGSLTTFAMAAGGGADFWFSPHFGARLLQFDYLDNNNTVAGMGHGNFRLATGLMFEFGH